MSDQGIWVSLDVFNKMMEALRYYANPRSYENGIMPYHRVSPPIPAEGIRVKYKDLMVMGVPDGGRVAREALQ